MITTYFKPVLFCISDKNVANWQSA